MNITWATPVYNRGGHTVTMLLPAGRGWWPGYLSCDDISNEYWTLTHAWPAFPRERRRKNRVPVVHISDGVRPLPSHYLTHSNTDNQYRVFSPLSHLLSDWFTAENKERSHTPHLLPQPLGGGVGLWCASPLSLCFPCEQRESAGYISYVLYYISLYEQYDILYICRGREEGG